MDLLIWIENDEKITGSQLCCDNPFDSRVLTWFNDRGYFHNRVDDGGSAAGKMTPLLIRDGKFDHARISDQFFEKSRSLPAWIADFVHEKLTAYSKS